MKTEKKIAELEKRCAHNERKARDLKRQLKEDRAEIERLQRINGLLRRQSARLQAVAIRCMGAEIDRRTQERRAS